MNKIVLFAITLVQGLATIGQVPEPKRYNFSRYTQDSGLSSYQVNGTVQDEEGFIWLATNEGLQRFDGLRYKSFKPIAQDSTSLPSKSILQLLIDKNKNLWILTAEGDVGVFDTKKFKFKKAVLKLGNASLLESTTLLKRLITDEFGNIFFLLPGKELATYNKERNEISASHNFFLTKPQWAIEDFVQQPGSKKYWMCLGKDGFAMFDGTSGTLSYHGNNLGQEKIIEYYKNDTAPFRLYFDTSARSWHVGSDGSLPYLYCFDMNKGEPVLDRYGFAEQVPQYHEIHQLLEQDDGSIWISGINILAKFLEAGKQFQQVYNGYVDEQSIYFTVITDINEDREHNIWVSTANNGVFRFNPSEEFFTNIEHPSKLTGTTGSGAPITFVQDFDGSILVGVWNDHLYRYDKDLKPLDININGFPKDQIVPVIDMCLSKKGKFIWMALKDGIYKYDQLKRNVQLYPLPELQSRIRALEEDGKGNLWIGLQEHGVYKWDPIKGEKDFEKGISKFMEIPSAKITDIMVDRKGHVWVGTSGNGAYVIDPQTDTIVRDFKTLAPEGIPMKERTVSAFLDYNDSIVIIGTRTRLLSYNRLRQKLSPLGSSETTSGSISSMEKDAANYVWLSTTAGLYRINVQKGVFIKFNRDDGIRNDFFITSASHVLPDGRMLFGASRTIVAFDPLKIKLDTNYPTMHITDFKVMNRSLAIDSLLQQKVIELAPNENSITIDLSTMSYNTAYAIRYKLEGLDNNWKVADRTYQIAYPYLPSGSYTLHVNSIDAEGAEGINPLTLNIEVATTFWKTWWFYGLLALFLGFVLFWLDKARIQQKVAVHRMRNDIAVSLTEEVNTALNNINILSEMAKIKARTDPQKSAEFIDQIHSKSHNMIIAMDDMLWTISPENDSMERTIERMREYIDSLNNRHKVGIEMVVDGKVRSLKLDMQFRHELFLLFKESIKGLVKANASQCKIQLASEKSSIFFTVEFNAENCDRQRLNHLQQRQDMVKRLKAINGNTLLHSDNSVFELKIPLKTK